MLKTNYSWNVEALVNWLDNERPKYLDAQDLADNLQIQLHTLLKWVTGSSLEMDFEHVQSIAQYRGWSTQETATWLDINLPHADTPR